MDQANWIRARALMDERMREVAEGISQIEPRGQIHLFDVAMISTTDCEDPSKYAHLPQRINRRTEEVVYAGLDDRSSHGGQRLY
jgi:hypothetical protein